MQQLINRKVYNTESAEKIAQYGSIVDKNDFNTLAETLYKTSDGEYFLHCRGGAATQYGKHTNEGKTFGEEIQLLTKEEALKWCEKRSIDPEKIIEEFADLIENADEMLN